MRTSIVLWGAQVSVPEDCEVQAMYRLARGIPTAALVSIGIIVDAPATADAGALCSSTVKKVSLHLFGSQSASQHRAVRLGSPCVAGMSADA